MTIGPSAGAAPELRAEVHLTSLSPDGGPPDSHFGLGLVHEGDTNPPREVASVGFTWQPLSADEHDPDRWATVCDWLLAFDVPRIDPTYLGQRIGLRLIAGLMASFSVGRSVSVTMVAEPRGWQSLKLARREAEVPAIARHWARLGLEPLWDAYSSQPAVVARVAQDYSVPVDLASWGPHFELAAQTATLNAPPGGAPTARISQTRCAPSASE